MHVEEPRIIFFLGAGASVKAGVNTTFGLVDEFKSYLENKKQLHELLMSILSVLQQNSHKVDIEELLQTIDQLEFRDQENLLKFYDSKNFILKNPDNLKPLKEELKRFINKATTVKQENVQYLSPFFSYGKSLRIFSVNYDISVEQLCNVFKKTYTDGFDHTWNPQLFKNTNLDIHLYKLHGSIMWYKTDRGDYLKIPLPPGEFKIKLIFGEEAQHLMIYPMQKWEFEEPLLEMMHVFREYLEKCQFVIVAGYSFRDKHMLRIFHEAARKNSKLIVILVDPNARQIYEETLRYYVKDDVTKIPSPLENRVVCLQYKFENILPRLYQHYRGNAQQGLLQEESIRELTYQGVKPKWFENEGPLKYYFDSEFIDRADLLRDEVNWDEIMGADPFTVLSYSLKMFTVAEEQNLESKLEWLKIFLKASECIATFKLGMGTTTETNFVLWFVINESRTMPYESLIPILDKLLEFLEMKKDSISKDSLAFDLYSRLDKFSKYLKMRRRGINFEIVDTIKDGNTYDDKEEAKYYRNALKENQLTRNQTTDKNFRWAFLQLEIKRLVSIFGEASFGDYLAKTITEKTNPNYAQYKSTIEQLGVKF